jgi:signal transduction histidine kinase
LKEAIIGYVTGLINIHQLSAESFEGSGEQISAVETHNYLTKELSDLLDFIENMAEEDKTDLIKTKGMVEGLLRSNSEYRHRMQAIEDENKKLNGKITDWKKNNSKQLQKIEELRKRIIMS